METSVVKKKTKLQLNESQNRDFAVSRYATFSKKFGSLTLPVIGAHWLRCRGDSRFVFQVCGPHVRRCFPRHSHAISRTVVMLVMLSSNFFRHKDLAHMVMSPKNCWLYLPVLSEKIPLTLFFTFLPSGAMYLLRIRQRSCKLRFGNKRDVTGQSFNLVETNLRQRMGSQRGIADRNLHWQTEAQGPCHCCAAHAEPLATWKHAGSHCLSRACAVLDAMLLTRSLWKDDLPTSRSLSSRLTHSTELAW